MHARICEKTGKIYAGDGMSGKQQIIFGKPVVYSEFKEDIGDIKFGQYCDMTDFDRVSFYFNGKEYQLNDKGQFEEVVE